MISKIKVALVFNEKDTAVEFVRENTTDGMVVATSVHQFVYETPILRFEWIKPFCNFKGQRVNFVFTTKAIRDTQWFDSVIRPMQMGGTGIFDVKDEPPEMG